jgi:hypothetical protein
VTCCTIALKEYGLQRISWFVLVLGCVGVAGYSQTAPQPVPASDDGPAVYVVRVISVPSAQRDAFVACLAQNDLPFWRGLKEKGLLSRVSVFETIEVTKSEPGAPAWNFAISTQLAEGANADSFLEAVGKPKSCENAAGVELRRVETLRTTPNCNSIRTTAAGDLKAREGKVSFYVEYIAVKDTPEMLDGFRKFMSQYECLAGDLMIREGWGYIGLALETAKVNYSQPGMPSWNQIHITAPFTDVDSAAALAAWESSLRKMNTGDVDWVAFRASLAVMHTKDDRARELFELAVR